MTEIVFMSNLMGSGRDWSITTGLPDHLTFSLLRGMQGHVYRELRLWSVLGNGLGELA